MKDHLSVSKLAFLIIVVFTTNVFSGTTGKIAGSVVDGQTSEPLIGVNVLLKGTFLGASTDTDGNYVILNIAPGTYTIEVFWKSTFDTTGTNSLSVAHAPTYNYTRTLFVQELKLI